MNIDDLKKFGCYQEGHFELSSGLHSDINIQAVKLLQTWEEENKVIDSLDDILDKYQNLVRNVDVVISANEGISFAHLCSWKVGEEEIQDIRCIWCERIPEIDYGLVGCEVKEEVVKNPTTVKNSIKIKSGKFQLHEGFEIKKGEKVLITEDVTTTGKTIGEISELVKEHGGEVVGAISIIDRREKRHTIGTIYNEKKIIYECGEGVYTGIEPFISLIQLDIKTWKPEDCPLCKKDKGELPFEVGDLACIPDAVYDYFRVLTEIHLIENDNVWLSAPDDNCVSMKSLRIPLVKPGSRK